MFLALEQLLMSTLSNNCNCWFDSLKTMRQPLGNSLSYNTVSKEATAKITLSGQLLYKCERSPLGHPGHKLNF